VAKLKNYSCFLLLAFSLEFSCSYAAQNPVLQVETGDRFLVDLRYDSENNFLHRNVYQPYGLNQCLVHPDLWKKLEKLEKPLTDAKLKLVFFDCYRPLTVQRAMWALVPDARFVANPLHGSNHNRGTAIDVSLASEDGRLLPMPSDFDAFTPQAASDFKCPVSLATECANRDRLKALMLSIGLEGLKTEWWHFQLPGSKSYPLIESTDDSSKAH